MARQGKLELTWVGKDERPRLEPRILVEDPARSYGDPKAENILIFGDNLLALKALEQEFTSKIKCIYIDPPYNTGSAFTHYDDGLEHSIWLSLMRDRLEILRQLLTSDGLIFCSIDNTELFYAGVLFDEVFGRKNRIELFVWKKSYGGGAKSRYVVNQSEFILCYAKEIEQVPPLFLPPDEKALRYYKYKDEHFETRGAYRLQPLATTSNDERPNLRYPIKYKDQNIWPEKQWQWSEERVKKALDANGIVFTERNGKITVSYKQYLRDEEGEERQTKPTSIIDGFYTQHGTYESVALFGQENKFQFPKPEGLLHYLLLMATNSGDWVLDSFAGSGTTGAVAHKMGRRWIMIELGEHCHTHIIPRLQKVIDGTDQGGISKAVNWHGGGGFKYYRLAESLLVRDKDLSTKDAPVYLINPRYNEKMLIQAICKIENFHYRNDGRLHGVSSESRFLHVTTNLITQTYLDSLAEDIGLDQSLLIYCTRRRSNFEMPENIEIKLIPRDLLAKCDFREDA